MKNALIFGITGQDGAYLTRLLAGRGYRVFGASREAQERETASLEALGVAELVHWAPVDYTDSDDLRRVIVEVEPDEVYNLAAMSSVGHSFKDPLLCAEINGQFVARLLEATRMELPQARMFQASSAEVFGAQSGKLHEETPLRPCSPYGVAKANAQMLVECYRDSFGMHVSSGILFNHESPLRETRFVTRKITNGVARIKFGLQKELRLGNLSVARDWGFAGDYVEAMWRMMQQELPGDFIIATGKLHHLNDWVQKAFAAVGLEEEEFVKSDVTLLRPTDAAAPRGNPAKAKEQLGWTATMQFDELVAMMVEEDLKRVAEEVG